MIINGNQYKITYPYGSNWEFAIDDKTLTSGQLDRVDYGFTRDVITANLTAKGVQADINALADYINLNRDIDVEFNLNEQPFGPHIEHGGVVFSGTVIKIREPRRINQSFHTLSIPFRINNPSLKPEVVGTLDNLIYPPEYSGGEMPREENNLKDNYGNFYNYRMGTNGIHDITFSMKENKAAELLKYLTDSARADGFPLPADWQSLEPFAGKSYTHAFLVGMGFSRARFKIWNITLKLLSYNNV